MLMKIIRTNTPINLRNKFMISKLSKRCIIPKFSLTRIMNKSLIFNSSKILNYFLQHDITYYNLSIDVFKKSLKKHLIFTQSASVKGDNSWLPCNHDIFSNIVCTWSWVWMYAISKIYSHVPLCVVFVWSVSVLWFADCLASVQLPCLLSSYFVFGVLDLFMNT